MQGGRQGRDSFFDSDPFADFGGFGGFGGHQSLVSSFFGGRSPFDDPFFTHPFPSPCSLFGPSHNPFPSPCSIIRSSRPFPSPCSIFGSSRNPFPGAPSAGPQHNKRRGPVIEEIDSDDENAEDGGASNAEDNPRKYCRLDKEPYVETPDDKADEERNNHIQHRSDYSSRMPPQSQSHCFTFRSSSVSYGGANGAYYTKSMTRRAGSDGVAYEEFKEADSTTGQANHRISRGLRNKGHTLSRKLNSDGRVDSMQTLHNLNEDELPVFEQAWEGSAARHLPGWRPRIAGDNNTGYSGPGVNEQTNRAGWALPSTQLPEHPGRNDPGMASGSHPAAHMQWTGRRAADRATRGRARP